MSLNHKVKRLKCEERERESERQRERERGKAAQMECFCPKREKEASCLVWEVWPEISTLLLKKIKSSLLVCFSCRLEFFFLKLTVDGS